MIGSPRQRLLARLDEVGEPVAVALGRQVALELGDEQAAVGQDQDPERARRLDEARRGDRLARRGRMAEAVAADGARILADEAFVLFLVGRPRRSTSSSSSASSASSSASACPLPFSSSSAWRWFAAISSVSIPASASIWCLRSSVPAAVAGGFDESTRSSPSRKPNRTFQRGEGVRAAGLDLGERLVERGAAGRAGRQHLGRLFAGMEEGLARPVLRTERVGLQAIRRVRRVCRLKYRF